MQQYNDHTEWMHDDRHDAPKHISEIVKLIVSKWPDERQAAFNAAMEG